MEIKQEMAQIHKEKGSFVITIVNLDIQGILIEKFMVNHHIGNLYKIGSEVIKFQLITNPMMAQARWEHFIQNN